MASHDLEHPFVPLQLQHAAQELALHHALEIRYIIRELGGGFVHE